MRTTIFSVVVMLGAAGLIATAGGRPEWAPSQAAARPSLPDLSRQAFHAAYNLDYSDATIAARRAVSLYPDESGAHRVLASVLWLDILFARGTCTVDAYLSGVTKMPALLPAAPAELETEFKNELAQSITLAEARLKASPRDIEARHDVGSAYAIQASYSASVEGSMVAAFRSAKRAYDAQEEVLEQEPGRADATFTVGIYRYVISGLSLPSRFVAYLAGFGGGKERGIQMLESTTQDPDVHADAKAALLLIYTREGRHADALRIVRELGAEFPRNRLLVLEAGAAAIRAGHPLEADETLTRGLAALATEKRPKFPGELATWHYKRAMARVLLNRPGDAQTDLNAAVENAPAEWIRGRIRLEIGKVADLSGRRDDAIDAYKDAKAICEKNSDGACANQAGNFIKRPFRY